MANLLKVNLHGRVILRLRATLLPAFLLAFSFSHSVQGQCYTTQFDCGETHILFVAGRCLNPDIAVCNEVDDCFNNKDEEHCGGGCGSNQFSCVSGSVACIGTELVCDGEDNCLDGSDEQFCGRRTPPGEDADRCAIPTYGCTTHNDYHYKRDVSSLDRFNDFGDYKVKDAAAGLGRDGGGGGGVYKRGTGSGNFCDDSEECVNGDDEKPCGIGSCPSNMFSCNNGYCLDPGLVCDDIDDCGDGSDEGGLCTCSTVPVIIIGSVVGGIVFILLLIICIVICCVLRELIVDCFKAIFKAIFDFFTCACLRKSRRSSFSLGSSEPATVELSVVRTEPSGTAAGGDEESGIEKGGPPFSEPQVSGPPFPEPQSAEADPPPYTGPVGDTIPPEEFNPLPYN